MKVAPKSLKVPTPKDDLTEEQEEAINEKMADSSKWIIARTIYCSLSVNGEVRLQADKESDTTQLTVGFGGF